MSKNLTRPPYNHGFHYSYALDPEAIKRIIEEEYEKTQKPGVRETATPQKASETSSKIKNGNFDDLDFVDYLLKEKREQSGRRTISAPSAPQEKKFCRICGKRLSADAIYCSACGTKINR